MKTVNAGMSTAGLVLVLVVGALVGVYAWNRLTTSGFIARLMSTTGAQAITDALVNAPGSGGV